LASAPRDRVGREARRFAKALTLFSSFLLSAVRHSGICNAPYGLSAAPIQHPADIRKLSHVFSFGSYVTGLDRLRDAAATLITGELPMLLILLVILLLLGVGAFPSWPYSREWGYYPSGGIGLVVVILLILLLIGRI
jgi:hypothetical protein